MSATLIDAVVASTTENVQLTAQNQSAEQEIQAAWQAYQTVERHGLDFGRVCYGWQQKFSSQGSRTGGGLRPILDKVGIPASTAYFWINRYKKSEGILDTDASENPSVDPADSPFISPDESLRLGVSITPDNLDDTRCLSMAKERLLFVYGKIELLLDAKDDPKWDRQQVEAALSTYRRAIGDFSNFIRKLERMLN